MVYVVVDGHPSMYNLGLMFQHNPPSERLMTRVAPVVQSLFISEFSVNSNMHCQ